MAELTGPVAERLAEQLCAKGESLHFETKRVSGKMVGKALEAVCAFANTEGGILALGATRMLKSWVESGLLHMDDTRGKRGTVYRKVQGRAEDPLALFSEPLENKPANSKN